MRYTVVISDGLWRRHYGADPNMVGKTIQLGGEPYVVIGIIGPSFHFDPAPDVWIPFQFDRPRTIKLTIFWPRDG